LPSTLDVAAKRACK